ncbi:MAG: hypothetical protein JO312_26645 [Hyphomicrobiales bacterium]|nr:hypothetical protein [Hyphomicrobiales bacterium]
MPMSIPDDLHHAIMQAAAPIVAAERPAFLEAMAVELIKHPEIGEGLVHRCAADLQRRFTVEARHETAPPRLLGKRLNV